VARSKLAKSSESAAQSLTNPWRLSSRAIALFQDLFRRRSRQRLQLFLRQRLIRLFTEAASVKAALASGTRFKLSSANPSLGTGCAP